MRFNRLQDWLAWQEVNHPVGIDLGLQRVGEVGRRLGLTAPSDDRKVITVAGTNGKGSCVRVLDALLRCSGKTTGCFYSPHILRYNERIHLNGEYASDIKICQAFAAIDEACGDLNLTLTYFEYSALAAMWLFQHESVEYWLLEVGLGGRLDATNILDCDVAVITSIDLDHTDWLGDTRELIGREKAGICRQGKPLICVDPCPPKSVFHYAESLSSPIFTLAEFGGLDDNKNSGPTSSRLYPSEPSVIHLMHSAYEFNFADISLPKYSVLAALLVMQQLELLSVMPNTTVQKVLSSLTLPGRMQIVEVEGRKVIMDVAHNPAALSHCVNSLLARHLSSGEKVDLVLAMMKDKNIEDSISALAKSVDNWYVCELPSNQRAVAATDLMQTVVNKAPQANTVLCENVASAIEMVLQSGSEQPIFVTGSFFTVAAATEYLQNRGVCEAT